MSRQQAWPQSFWQSMRPHASGQAYQNYIDPALTDWRRARYGASYTRLTQVKARYDPGRVFTFPQAIRTVQGSPRAGHDGVPVSVAICARTLANSRRRQIAHRCRFR